MGLNLSSTVSLSQLQDQKMIELRSFGQTNHLLDTDYEDHDFYLGADGQIRNLSKSLFSSIKEHLFSEIRNVVSVIIIPVYKEIAGIGNTVTNGSLKVFKATKDFWVELEFVKFLTVVGKATTVMGFVIAAYNLVKGLERILTKEELAKRLEGFIAVLESISQGVKSSVAAAELLHLFGKVTEDAISWILDATVFSVILSAASLIADGKGFFDTREFLKELENLENEPTRSYKKILQKLVEVDENGNRKIKGIKKHLQLKSSDLESKVSQILHNYGHDEVKLKKIYQTLKGRVQTKINSHIVSAVASTVNLVGAAVFLSAPINPAGNAIMAVSSAISVGKYLYNRRATRIFTEKMNFYARNIEIRSVFDPKDQDENNSYVFS